MYLDEALPKIAKRLAPGYDPTTIKAQSHAVLPFRCMGSGCTEWVHKNVGNLVSRKGDKSLIFCKAKSCQAQRKPLVPPRIVLAADSLRECRPLLARQLADPALADTVSKKSRLKINFRCNHCNQATIHLSPLSIKDDELRLFCKEPACREQWRAVTRARGSYAKKATLQNSFSTLFPDAANKQHPQCTLDLKTLKGQSNEFGLFSCECCGQPVRRQLGDANTETAFFCAATNCETQHQKYSQLKDWKTRIATRGTFSAKHPALAAQWISCPTYPQLTPSDIPPNVRLEVNWRCPANPEHTWLRDVDARANNPGCPFCKSNISRTQLRFGCEIAGILGVAHENSKKFPIAGTQIEIDISLTLPHAQKIAIEVDGNWWHQHKLMSDQAKDRQLKSDGWIVIRLRDDRLPAITTPDKVVLYPGNGYYDQKWREAIFKVLDFIKVTTGAPVPRLADAYNQYLYEDEYQRLCKFYSIG